MRNEGKATSSDFFTMSEAPPLLPPFEGPNSSAQRVLIFSRENDTCLLLQTLLEMWGYQIDVSDSLAGSLAVIESRKPNLILVDSVLPFEKHLENIRRLRSHEISKEIPIVVISGFSQARFKNLSLDVGANGFLVKPLDFDLLENYLEKSLRKRSGKQL